MSTFRSRSGDSPPKAAAPGADSPAARPSAQGADDMRLVRRVLAGDRDAGEELGRRLLHMPRRLRAQNARLPVPLDEDEFLDRIQEATYALLCRLDRYDGRAALETWAHRFCTNYLLEGLRKRRRRLALAEDLGEEELRGESEAPESAGELTDDLDSALRTLEPDEAEAVRMKHFEGETFDTAGARLELSANTVKTRYYRAMFKLREHFKAHHPGLFPGGGC